MCRKCKNGEIALCSEEIMFRVVKAEKEDTCAKSENKDFQRA